MANEEQGRLYLPFTFGVTAEVLESLRLLHTVWPTARQSPGLLMPSSVMPVDHDLDAETADGLQGAFEEIAASSSRILKSLTRLNSLAQETYSELNATRQALAVKE